MCGILGFYAKQNPATVEKLFNTNLEEIKPRGIELDTLTRDQREFYGYARLPTDDINNTSLNEIQRINGSLLLFNGLITNTAHLQSVFNLPEETRKSDTLSLLQGFSKYQEEYVASCRGMFAFAFVTADHIFLVRDTIGIKPMYYIDDPSFFGFCSEIKGLLVNAANKIKEVKPGEIVMFDKKDHSIKTSSFIYRSYKNYGKADLLTCLKEAIVDPTKRYLEQSTDKKIGLLLSGGIDSSIIVKLLHNDLKPYFEDRIRVFCLGGKDSNDLVAAKRMAEDLGINLIHVEPYSESEALAKCADIVHTVESKLSRVVKVALLQDELGKKIQEEGIEILLSGEGSDELFFGYDRFINGLTPYQIEEMYAYFFNRVFYYTLLQRYDRVYARRLIEGRVPYLDQELIELSKKFTTEEKINHHMGGAPLSKIPLRIVGKEIGLPKEIYERKKEKMTYGVTKFPNQSDHHGYLEAYTLQERGVPLDQVIRQEYEKRFFVDGACVVDSRNYSGTEEEAMSYVNYFREINKRKERETLSL